MYTNRRREAEIEKFRLIWSFLGCQTQWNSSPPLAWTHLLVGRRESSFNRWMDLSPAQRGLAPAFTNSYLRRHRSTMIRPSSSWPDITQVWEKSKPTSCRTATYRSTTLTVRTHRPTPSSRLPSTKCRYRAEAETVSRSQQHAWRRAPPKITYARSQTDPLLHTELLGVLRVQSLGAPGLAGFETRGEPVHGGGRRPPARTWKRSENCGSPPPSTTKGAGCQRTTRSSSGGKSVFSWHLLL